MNKYKIYKNENEFEYLTRDELKERILSFKQPECDEKYIRNCCCICTIGIKSWFHGSGAVCSKECNYIFNKIFGSEKYKISKIERKEWWKFRKELWKGRGWVEPEKGSWENIWRNCTCESCQKRYGKKKTNLKEN